MPLAMWLVLVAVLYFFSTCCCACNLSFSSLPVSTSKMVGGCCFWALLSFALFIFRLSTLIADAFFCCFVVIIAFDGTSSFDAIVGSVSIDWSLVHVFGSSRCFATSLICCHSCPVASFEQHGLSVVSSVFPISLLEIIVGWFFPAGKNV